MNSLLITRAKLRTFLNVVDTLFPVPLSKKQDLDTFVDKLLEKAILCVAWEGERIVALVAGYADNVIDRLGYISIVATLPEAQGRGLASEKVQEFLDIARDKGLRGVHLYAVPDNLPAIKMYKKLGFEVYCPKNESRPEDAHLIYYIEREKQ